LDNIIIFGLKKKIEILKRKKEGRKRKKYKRSLYPPRLLHKTHSWNENVEKRIF